MARTRITSSNVKAMTSGSFAARKRKTKLSSAWLTPANVNKGFATDGNFHLQDHSVIDSDLDDMVALGAGWVRLSVDWSQVQASGSSSFSWNADYAVTTAIAKGLKVLACILFTPSWGAAAGGAGTYTDAPNPTKYATFCAQVVAHYKALGVRHYEIWNEPNIPNFWNPVSAANYTTALKAAYSPMKFVDPACTVITGGLSPAPDDTTTVNPRTFLTAIYTNGGKGYFDGVGMHPYTQPSLPGATEDWNPWNHMTQMRTTMVGQSDDKRMWVTESGAPTNGADDTKYVSEDEQAEIVGKGFEVWSGYSWGGNEGEGAPLFVYQHRDQGTSTSTEQNFFGVRANDRTVKPAAQAFTDGVIVASPWTYKWTGNTIADWSSFEEGYAGSSITDEEDGIHLFVPASAVGRDHCEMHDNDDGGCLIPGEQAYEWSFSLNEDIVLPDGDYFTICQQHGNNNPGYTGGVGIDPDTYDVIVRVAGGTRISGNRYEYEHRFIIGTFVPGTTHTVRVEAKWASDWTGYVAASLDGGTRVVDSNVPTASALSTNEMFYLGFYPDDVVSDMEMVISDIKTQSPS